MSDVTQRLKASFNLARKTIVSNGLTVGSGMIAGQQFASGNDAGGYVMTGVAFLFGIANAFTARGLESEEIGLAEGDEPKPSNPSL